MLLFQFAFFFFLLCPKVCPPHLYLCCCLDIWENISESEIKYSNFKISEYNTID